VLEIKCIFQPDFRDEAHRPPTTARNSTGRASRYKKYAGTVPFGKLSLKYFPYFYSQIQFSIEQQQQ